MAAAQAAPVEHSGSAGDPAADTSADRTANPAHCGRRRDILTGDDHRAGCRTRRGGRRRRVPDGVPESGINLQIVRKAEGLLVFLGRSVRLTRTGEEAIYSPEAQTLREKKVSDLKNRVALINALPHAVLLSIHQNSMPQHPAVHGAQVFSNPQEPAAGLAQSIQQALNLTVNTGNEKTAKAIGDSVYLMKHITCPGVLVECGFLSNSHEAQLLRQPEQQKRLVAAIVAGYLNFGNH